MVLGGDSSTLPRSWSFQVQRIREWAGREDREPGRTSGHTSGSQSPRRPLGHPFANPPVPSALPSLRESAAGTLNSLIYSSSDLSKVGTRSWPALSAGGRKMKWV